MTRHKSKTTLWEKKAAHHIISLSNFARVNTGRNSNQPITMASIIKCCPQRLAKQRIVCIIRYCSLPSYWVFLSVVQIIELEWLASDCQWSLFTKIGLATHPVQINSIKTIIFKKGDNRSCKCRPSRSGATNINKLGLFECPSTHGNQRF